jgi:hypothetical protein
MGPTPYVWTVLDNWYATVNGSDPLPDVKLARIPAESLAKMSNVVGKTIVFEGVSHPTNATLITDNTTNAVDTFKVTSQTYIKTQLLASGYAMQEGNLDDLAPSAVRFTLTNSVNSATQGRHLLSFVGHGSKTNWCAEDVCNINLVSGLTNTVLPIVTVFTCLNGYSHDPFTESLAEAFVERENRAAVACVSPGSLSFHPFAEKIAEGFFLAWTNTGVRLGDLLEAGQLNLWNFNPTASEIGAYGIAGDAALKVR